MEKSKIILPKGKSIKFLDYTIKNSLNNDGMVLFKDKADGYETHLGNYGTGTQENIDYCKKCAVLFFMTARPSTFAHSVVNKMKRKDSGTMHEFYLLKDACKKEGIELPSEIQFGDSMNAMIYFKGEPLSDKPENKKAGFKDFTNVDDAVAYAKQINNPLDKARFDLKKLEAELILHEICKMDDFIFVIDEFGLLDLDK
jgi:hypothetical protein